MSTTLEVKLREQSSADSTLAGFLSIQGDPQSPFRWYDTQLPQGTDFPSVVAQLISDPSMTVSGGRLPTGFARMQFTIWDTDAERARAVESALIDFLGTFSGAGLPGTQSNSILNRRQMLFPATAPSQGRYQRIVDAWLFEDDSV